MPVPVTITAAMRPAEDTTADAHRWDVTAETLDNAMTEARTTVPDGWVLLHVQVHR